MSIGIGSIANTGLKAAMTNMDTISNNIANSNTVGFKKSMVSFSDIYPASVGQISGSASGGQTAGYGVQVAGITQDFSLGSVKLTNRGLDLCLTNNGFFVQKNAAGQVSYTRAGNLDLDINGYFMGGNGKIQGYPAIDGKVVASGALVDMQVSQSPIPARATASPALELNLDASSVVPASTFSTTDPSSFNFRSDTTVYDSLGSAYNMSLYYIKQSDNNWTAQVFVNDQNIGNGNIAFQNNGTLASVNGLNNISWSPTSGANAPQNLNINLNGSTQFSGANNIVTNNQDGYPAGLPTGFNVDNSGNISISYSNGHTRMQGQIAVASFSAPQGLAQTDNMSWLATSDSGNPLLNPSASSGAINAGMLELSNVDMTEELINLMGAQHDFQANSQVVKTYNQILQTVENM